MPEKLLGYIYLTLAMLLVGSTVIASKTIASGLPVFSATTLRFTVALPCFLLLMRMTGARFPKLSTSEWFILSMQAAAGSVGYCALLIAGMYFSSAADAGVIIGTLPVVSAAVAIFVLKERPHRYLLLAVALAGAGVLSIVMHADSTSHHSLTGNFLIFAAVLCESLFILLNKRLQTSIAPLAQSTIMSALGLALACIPALFEAPWHTSITINAVLATMYYALVPTVAGFLLWYAGAARVTGSEAAVFTSLAPVSAVLLAIVVLNETVSTRQYLGIACVLIAVVGMTLGTRRIEV